MTRGERKAQAISGAIPKSTSGITDRGARRSITTSAINHAAAADAAAARFLFISPPPFEVAPARNRRLPHRFRAHMGTARPLRPLRQSHPFTHERNGHEQCYVPSGRSLPATSRTSTSGPGGLANLPSLDLHPSPAELAATAKRQCTYGVQVDDTDITFTAVWDPRSALRERSQIAGACFMFDKSGQPLRLRQ
ncbi:hypothetical protein GCM10027601_02720 [Nocardioides ungokensis]